jgi:hypothetical protein
MTDPNEKPTQELTTQQRAAVGKSAQNRVSGKLKTALDDMCWNGTPWDEAARKVNFRVRSMRMAMGKPHVLKYLRLQRGVVLAQASSRNLQRLGELRDQDINMAAAVQAARALEGLATEQFSPVVQGYGRRGSGYVIDLSEDQKPGVVIVINNPAPPRPGDDALDITPTIPVQRGTLGFVIRG